MKRSLPSSTVALWFGLFAPHGVLGCMSTSMVTAPPTSTLQLESIELAPERVEGAVRSRDAIAVIANVGSAAIEITRLRPTVSTVVNTDRGLPPFVLAPGQHVRLTISARTHTPEPVTRRVKVECITPAGAAALEVLVPLEGGSGS